MAPHEIDHDHMRHEESDVNVRAILGFGGGLAATMIIVLLVVWGLFVYLDRRAFTGNAPDPMAAGQDLRLPPEPRLQRTPREDLRAFRAAEDELLKRYEWVDRGAGIVRIPIEEAMKLTLQRGLPVRQETEQSK